MSIVAQYWVSAVPCLILPQSQLSALGPLGWVEGTKQEMMLMLLPGLHLGNFVFLPMNKTVINSATAISLQYNVIF